MGKVTPLIMDAPSLSRNTIGAAISSTVAHLPSGMLDRNGPSMSGRPQYQADIGVITTVLMFLSPIFYPVTALPEAYRSMLYLNPLMPVIEQTREVLFWGRAPDFWLLGICWVLSAVVAWLGFAWFQKTRKGFADVL